MSRFVSLPRIDLNIRKFEPIQNDEPHRLEPMPSVATTSAFLVIESCKQLATHLHLEYMPRCPCSCSWR